MGNEYILWEYQGLKQKQILSLNFFQPGGLAGSTYHMQHSTYASLQLKHLKGYYGIVITVLIQTDFYF